LFDIDATLVAKRPYRLRLSPRRARRYPVVRADFVAASGWRVPARRHFGMQSSWSSDWVATVIQGLPGIATLSRHMRPTMRIGSVASLDAELIRSLGIRGMIWDVDGTLMRHHGTAVAPHLADTFARLVADPALRHVVLSNCDEDRFVQLSSIFPAIPIIRVYDGDSGLLVRRRVGDDDSGPAPGDLHHRHRALRKPSVAMVGAALDALGCASPAHALMVGDQYLTDIAPANMLGVRTAKVRTVDPRSFPMMVRALQVAERVLYRLSPSETQRE